LYLSSFGFGGVPKATIHSIPVTMGSLLPQPDETLTEAVMFCETKIDIERENRNDIWAIKFRGVGGNTFFFPSTFSVFLCFLFL